MDLDFVTLALGVVLAVVLWQLWRAWQESRQAPAAVAKFQVGDITAESLATYNGLDWTRPTLIAVQGKIYDVTGSNDTYGPGKELHAYAGRECSRALAKGSTEEADLCDDLAGLTAEEEQRLQDKLAAIRSKHDQVGQVIALRELTAEDVAAHDGSDPSKPMYLSIRGTVYDITAGKAFYGPDGVYPFAGHEVARAFAMLSTDVADCTADLDGMSHIELENLREWEQKFNYKYPVVGRIRGSKEPAAAGAAAAAAAGSQQG